MIRSHRGCASARPVSGRIGAAALCRVARPGGRINRRHYVMAGHVSAVIRRKNGRNETFTRRSLQSTCQDRITTAGTSNSRCAWLSPHSCTLPRQNILNCVLDCVMFQPLAPYQGCHGSTVSLMLAASLWAALRWWAGPKWPSNCYVVIESWQGYVKENFAVLSGLAAAYDECKNGWNHDCIHHKSVRKVT